VREEQVDRVVELMARMAAQDASAAFDLYEEFGPVIRRVVRGHLADLGTHAPSAADLDGLTLDAVMALLDAAPSGRHDGGAMPWTWAERRLRSLCQRHIGQWADVLSDDHDGPAGPAVDHQDHDDMDHLARVATDDETIQLLLEGLALTSTARDAQLFIALKAQAAAGDPSPSVTVAAEHAMKPDAVRQAARRTRVKLVELAEKDKRFAPLADLPLLQP
jgi:hypothetical protein